MAAVDGEAWLRRTRMLENAMVTAPTRAYVRACPAMAKRSGTRVRMAAEVEVTLHV
jgi:hypothetical protein